MSDFEPVLTFHKIFQVERGDETAVVTLLVESDRTRYNELHVETGRVAQLLADPQIKNLVVDFNQVHFLSSVFIGAIVQMARQVMHGPGRTLMCNLSENVREILKTMNLFRLWPCVESRQKALEVLAGGAAAEEAGNQ